MQRGFPLAGKRALACGASRGIGRACALEFARLGAGVLAVARDRELLGSLVAEMEAVSAAAGIRARHGALPVDMRDLEALEAAVREQLESGPIHVLLHNTGGPAPGALAEAGEEELLDGLRLHLLSAHRLARLLVPGMRAARFGRIVNIVSTSVREPIPGLGVSNTVRGAMASWAKTLSAELAPHGITVNNVLPGATRTERLRRIIEVRARRRGVSPATVEEEMKAEIPAGRFAEPAEIAAAAGFLASPAAGYITGVSLAVDGGRTRSI
ncbi:MAG: SDR family oxidoreductase [Acidobacteria bacterium]|nr:MAG: SDR family oxidoreductase [Acidobacteriota bacterium]